MVTSSASTTTAYRRCGGVGSARAMADVELAFFRKCVRQATGGWRSVTRLPQVAQAWQALPGRDIASWTRECVEAHRLLDRRRACCSAAHPSVNGH
jgi:hypothetical protein